MSPGTITRRLLDPLLDFVFPPVCLGCDRVVDISDERLDSLEVPDTSPFGFEVSDVRVQLRGICRHCREEETQA